MHQQTLNKMTPLNALHGKRSRNNNLVAAVAAAVEEAARAVRRKFVCDSAPLLQLRAPTAGGKSQQPYLMAPLFSPHCLQFCSEAGRPGGRTAAAVC